MTIIAISGKAGAGKSTLAQHIQHILAREHLFGMGVPVCRAFGDAIKVEAAEVYGFPLGWAYSQQGKLKPVPNGMLVREALQQHGARRRKEDELYWVKKFMADIALDVAQGNTIICHDMRMPEEFEALRKAGAIMVRIEPFVGWEPGPGSSDITETALDGNWMWDRTFRPHFGKLAMTAAEIVRSI